MEEFVAEIDHNELRPLQKQGFLCGANCCDTARTQEDLQRWQVPDHAGWLYSIVSIELARDQPCDAVVTDAKPPQQLPRTLSTKPCKTSL